MSDFQLANKPRVYKTRQDRRLADALRVRMAMAVRNDQKAGSAVRDLGCSIPEFRAYIEAQWEPWMNWDNWGLADETRRTWQIDHIIPLSSFTLSVREEFLKAAHYSNQQPLESHENASKGSKMPD